LSKKARVWLLNEIQDLWQDRDKLIEILLMVSVGFATIIMAVKVMDYVVIAILNYPGYLVVAILLVTYWWWRLTQPPRR